MKSKRRVVASVIVSLLAFSMIASAQLVPPPGKRAAAAPPAIATIGPRRVARDDFERRVALAEAEYRQRNGVAIGDDVKSMFRRQMLENMIRLHLLVLEAQRQNVTASAEEADEALKRDAFFNPGGRFDPQKFAEVKATNAPTYQQTIAELRLQIAGQKMQKRVMQERAPSDSVLRDAAARSLGHVGLEYLALELPAFDGRYTEPREAEILGYYRSHAAEFRRPERASLTILFVDQPALSESLRRIPGRAQAWDAGMRQRADSALAALRAGANFDSLAPAVGTVRSGVDVMAGNFPGFWHGSDEQNAAVLRTRAGDVLSQPVPANPGYLLARVERVRPAGPAPLAEVAADIRRTMRSDLKLHFEDRELQAIYAQRVDSLRGPAVRLRYATVDTAEVDAGTPSEADLDRYYRGHLADYSTFDAKSGSIRSLPLDEVRGVLQSRWRHDRRLELAQGIAEGLDRAWSSNRRDPGLERSATRVREIGPIPFGAPVDTGLAAGLIADSLSVRGAVVQGALVPYARGFVIYRIFEVLKDYRPTFEQARGPLRIMANASREARDRVGARALFDRNPAAWAKGSMMNFSRALVPLIPTLDVPLKKEDVLRQLRDHIDQYSSPEQVHARHILISPTGPGEAADRVARQRADSLLRAIRAGEDFSTVARRVTDDPATRENGGDLGTFGRGAMLVDFERAAFSLRSGEVSAPVRTDEGYHLIQCVNHLPLYSQPLGWIYPNVGFDAAVARADSLSRRRADSLLTHARSPADARAISARLGLRVESNAHAIGDRHVARDLRDYFLQMESLKPGQFFPQAYRATGLGYWVTWLDSISAPQAPRFEVVEDQVVDAYRRGASLRAVQAKEAELDSMLTAGWSFDSLATLWGGLARQADVQPSVGIKALNGSRAVVDSLAFGARGGRALQTGEVSGWVRVPAHDLRVRLTERFEPRPGAIAQRMEADRRLAIERALRPYFDELSHRYTVQILDRDLKRISLPPLPPPPAGMP